jgi:hypothetical protein
MGMPYREAFPVGSHVRIADLRELGEFRKSWKEHHPLEDGQLVFAGRTAIVASVGFYHGGDVLYELAGVPGQWHECCLRPLTN